MKPSTLEKYKLVVDEWFVNGWNGTKAYQSFYPKASSETAKVEFNRILTNPNLQDYISDKSEKIANELQITLEKQLLELNDIKDKAKAKNRFTDAINALREQNKLLALYAEHNSQKRIKLDLSSLSTDEIRKRLEAIKGIET